MENPVRLIRRTRGRASTALVAAIACAALCAPAPAAAGELLSVEGARVKRVHDPFVPRGPAGHLGRAPRATASATAPRKQAKAKRRKGPTRGQKAVNRALAGELAAGRLPRADHDRYRLLYKRAVATRKRLPGARGRELGGVIATLEAIAIGRQLVASRMPALFLILRRNREYWPARTFPANRDHVTFGDSELVFEYYRGSGLQLQPLVNFKKANLMHAACVRDTGAECSRDRLARLLAEMTASSATRGGFRAWEYYFNFGGGQPPWISGMAQATGIQAFARAWQLLGDARLLTTAREAFGAFEAPPPVGVAAAGPLGGTHYLQYSFAPRLFIVNAFVQALIGLYDYAEITGGPAVGLPPPPTPDAGGGTAALPPAAPADVGGAATALRLFNAAEPAARLEVPRSDLGDWSRYSFGGRESTAGYHELLRELVASLCSRVRTPVYCDTARSFRAYATEPAELALLGPETVVKGEPTSVRFTVSKLSAVQLTITRDGKTALDKVLTFRRGGGAFAWTPRTAGTYSVRLAAKELRTGRGLRTRVAGEIESLPE